MKKYTLSVLALAAVLAAPQAYAGSAKKKDARKDEVYCEKATPETAAPAVLAAPGPQGWALSLSGGLMMMESKLTHETNGLDVKYKNNYKRLGLGIAHYWTLSNRVVWGLGLDIFAGFGSKKVNATMTQKIFEFDNAGNPTGLRSVRVPSTYTQKRPISALAFAKLGYAYGNFTPFLMLGIRESYVRHEIVARANNQKTIQKDVSFAVTPGLGFMYKMGNWSLGAEYMRGGESTFGLDAYADKVRNKTQSVVARVSYFF
ncbi:MAG TPA: hypothetical protein DIC42_05840 [Holosporales bacterium]|nr:hypothetical protein [Holosporales bacterium]